MADYATQLSALKEEQKRLVQRQAELLDKRRLEIGQLAEQLGLLEADNDILTGILLEAKKALDAPESKDGRLKEWRDAGATFRKAKDSRKQSSAAAPGKNQAGSASNP